MRIWIIWAIFAAVMGFVVGGSLVWGIKDQRQTMSIEQPSQHPSSKEETDEALAKYTLWLTAFTGVLALATIGLGVATTGLYVTGEKQAAITREALIGDQRAWITTKLEIGANGLFVRNGKLALDAKLRVSNLGRTPALNAQTTITLFEDCTPEDIKEFAAEHKELRPNGLFVSPNDHYYRPWIPSMIERDRYNLGAGRRVSPILVGCVSYGILQDNQVHQTAFAYLLGRTDGSPWGGEFELKDGRFDSKEIIISPWSGGFAT